jgi:hypothetical protein
MAPLLYLQGEIRSNWGERGAYLGDSMPGVLRAMEDLAVKLGATGHFVAVERTGYIAEYVVSGLNEFPLGGSFVLGIVGLIPRYFYPEKPTIHEGQFVAEEIAGVYSGAGYPAGLIGGLLLNFGIIGLLALVPYGALLGYVDTQAVRARRDLRAFLVVMAFGFLVTFDLLQSGIATSVTSIIVRGAMLVLLWRAITKRGGSMSRVYLGASRGEGGNSGERARARGIN